MVNGQDDFTIQSGLTTAWNETNSPVGWRNDSHSPIKNIPYQNKDFLILKSVNVRGEEYAEQESNVKG